MATGARACLLQHPALDQVALTVQLRYMVRVLERVPKSDREWASFCSFIAGEVLFDEFDHAYQREEETACFKLWVWMSDANRLATRGTLYLEEPVEVPPAKMHFWS